jgi:hypothetical protein
MVKNKEFEYRRFRLNQTSLICIFKAFGVILLHFKVDKLNQGVILQNKTIFF